MQFSLACCGGKIIYLIKFSLKFVPRLHLINHWFRWKFGACQAMSFRLLMHMCITWVQSVKKNWKSPCEIALCRNNYFCHDNCGDQNKGWLLCTWQNYPNYINWYYSTLKCFTLEFGWDLWCTKSVVTVRFQWLVISMWKSCPYWFPIL